MNWSWITQRTGQMLGAIASLCLFCIVLGPSPVQAVSTPATVSAIAPTETWQLTGQSADGLAQQYVDLNSMQGRDGYWLVHSYYVEQRNVEQRSEEAGRVDPLRADYLTLYDCNRQRYRDLETDSDLAPNLDRILLDSIPESSWGSATADPLNQATLDYVCQGSAVAQGLPPLSSLPQNSPPQDLFISREG